MLKRRLLRPLLTILLTALLGGLLAATLVRIAPGSDTGEEDLNFQLNPESKAYYHSAHAREQDVVSFYRGYITGIVQGDLGFSRLFQRPVRELLLQRLPVTARALAIGVAIGWALAFALALPATQRFSPAYSSASTLISGLFLCFPSAVLALLFLLARIPAYYAIALIVFPNVFRYLRNLLFHTYNQPHVIAAKARGLSRRRIFFWHILPNILAPLAALAGISVSIALGASIPIEVVSDLPGIGQLAWRAALGRDMPLLVGLTLIIAIITVTANSFSDLLAPMRTGDLR